MDSGGKLPLASFPDWETPITQESLDAIEAAFDTASASFVSSLIKRRKTCTDCTGVRSNGRRLPASISGCQQPRSLDRGPRRRILESENGSIQSSDAFSELSSPSIRQWNLVRSPHQVNSKMRYPSMQFGGRIVYSRTFSEVENATMELLEIIEAKKKSMDKVTLGFDIEWRPIFRRGYAQRKAAVMQICGDPSHCYVMHIIHSGIPPVLQSLLEDSTSVKVGVCIANDAVKVFKDYNVSVKDLEELSCLANLKLGGIPGKWSLSSLTELLACKELEKPNNIRLGNWEVDVLSKEQLQYAATDAFASWYIYQVLKSFPDAAEKQNEEPDTLQS